MATEGVSVRFQGVTQHDTILEPRHIGVVFGEGATVDDAWWQVAENLAERHQCDPRDFSYDDWEAA